MTLLHPFAIMDNRQDVEIFLAQQKAVGFKDREISQHRTIDGDHDRIETRMTTSGHKSFTRFPWFSTAQCERTTSLSRSGVSAALSR